MKNLMSIYADSYKEMKHFKTLVIAGMFGAISVILGYFTIVAGPYLKIGFSSTANEFVYMMFGPVVGCFYGGALDLVKYMANPTGPFFPGFTLNAMLAGILYGTLLYKKPITFPRVLVTKLIVIVICNMILNTYMNYLLGGQAVIAMIPIRIIKNLIQWPVDAVLFYVLAKRLEGLGFLKAVKSFT